MTAKRDLDHARKDAKHAMSDMKDAAESVGSNIKDR
jgi:hypothetical protein